MQWFVYIAESRTCRYYIGMTTDPFRRLEEHNSGSGSQLAAQQGPFRMRYVSPAFGDKSSARLREAQLKRWSKAKKEKLIRGEWE